MNSVFLIDFLNAIQRGSVAAVLVAFAVVAVGIYAAFVLTRK